MYLISGRLLSLFTMQQFDLLTSETGHVIADIFARVVLHNLIRFLFFPQTDLCGIKWRKLVHGEAVFSSEPLDDPVLSSFSRCLAADILCVWRRVATAAPPPVDPGGGAGGANGMFDNITLPAPPVKHPPLSLHAAKELWIFWYGEEPDLSGLVSPVLLAGGKFSVLLCRR